MRFALVNPFWKFEGSIYFGCPDPHLPLEYGYAQALLTAAGHDVRLFDCFLLNSKNNELREQLADFRPDFTVITTAPSYLFWRCAPPELRVPQLLLSEIRDVAGTVVVVGPHASTTPRRTLEKLSAEIAIRGEPEEILPMLGQSWSNLPSVCYYRGGEPIITGDPHYSDMTQLPPLSWPDHFITAHRHHHHRFDAEPIGPGAEVEASRGCPYKCSFCAKENFRNHYRRRPLATVLSEIASLLRQGVEYIYFIDEIFLPWRELLRALADRPLKIGIQTRIDLWNEETLRMLGAAHCVSVEAGVESITPSGRDLLDKQCKLSTEELTQRLIFAKQNIPFVQANLIALEGDNEDEIEDWRRGLISHGVWANKPVPLFPYPGSPDYIKRWGQPDEDAWERAHRYYLAGNRDFSDVQDQQPAPLVQLEQLADAHSSH
jgi:anaerobic magnesium-protoporphyrin IX monomethyl ester cyclase